MDNYLAPIMTLEQMVPVAAHALPWPKHYTRILARGVQVSYTKRPLQQAHHPLYKLGVPPDRILVIQAFKDEPPEDFPAEMYLAVGAPWAQEIIDAIKSWYRDESDESIPGLEDMEEEDRRSDSDTEAYESHDENPTYAHGDDDESHCGDPQQPEDDNDDGRRANQQSTGERDDQCTRGCS